jgi:naphthoate synthase/2-ketocyclohexanecarboxyl-CoA hydrolase
MFRAFYDASHDAAIGVIVVAGAGKHFGAGGDVAWEKWGLREAFYHRYPHNRLIRLSRKPVLAAVQGYCLGGHNHMAYCCDFTIAADDAIFGQAGPRVSSPADGFFVPYLTRVVGAKRAREMWMLCRRYTAHEAYAIGLVNRVVPRERLWDEVDRWCEELLRLSPGCLEVLKAAFDQETDDYPNMGVISSQLYPDWFDSPEGREGPAAFLGKRPARFWSLRKREAELRRHAAQDGAATGDAARPGADAVEKTTARGAVTVGAHATRPDEGSRKPAGDVASSEKRAVKPTSGARKPGGGVAKRRKGTLKKK